MKKFFALALALVLLFVMAAPTMAAGGEDAVSPCAVCANGNHSLYEADKTVHHTWLNNNDCQASWVTYYRCANCQYSKTETQTYSVSHSPRIYDSTCNGTMQTLYNVCSNCNHTIANTTQRCPGAVHTGACKWLPA